MGLTMVPHPLNGPGKAPDPWAIETAGESRMPYSAPATILLVALWIGLTAGYLDLGLMILKKRLIGDQFYRLGDHFRWIIPAGVTVLVLLPGAVLAFIACLRRGAAPPGFTVRLLSFLAYLDLTAAAPGAVGVAAVLMGAGRPDHPSGPTLPRAVPPAGEAYVPAARRRLAGDRAADVRRPCLVGAPGAGRPAPRALRSPECPADRLGHGTARESEPPRLSSTDLAQPGATGRPGRAFRSGFRRRPLDPAVAR